MPLPRAVRAEVLIAIGELEQGVARAGRDPSMGRPSRHEPSPARGASTRRSSTACSRSTAATRPATWPADGCGAHAGSDALDARNGRAGTRALRARAMQQLNGLRRAETTLAAHARHGSSMPAHCSSSAPPCAVRDSAPDARDPLREALDLATRCGAEPLAERARVELLATGARPRRAVLTGADALTASERRVAQMAGDGLTNREIAAALFISRKTVERHLANVYLKLDTNDRRTLAAALSPPQPG